MLTAVGAAVPASAATRVTPDASAPQTISTLANSGDFINGDTHGGQLYLSQDSATAYVFYPKGNGYYEISANDLCWNAYPAATESVGMDSCQPNDANEWFLLQEYNPAGSSTNTGLYFFVQESSGLKAWAVDYKIVLSAGGGPQDNGIWAVFNP
jgi:hypothetical protein